MEIVAAMSLSASVVATTNAELSLLNSHVWLVGWLVDDDDDDDDDDAKI